MMIERVVGVGEALVRLTPTSRARLEQAQELRVTVGTAGEEVAACRAGAGMVKLFPSDPAGVAYLRALRGPLPDVPFIPTGGIRIDAVPAYLAAGAVAVGLGSSLVSAEASLEAIGERAGRAVALAREAHVA